MVGFLLSGCLLVVILFCDGIIFVVVDMFINVKEELGEEDVDIFLFCVVCFFNCVVGFWIFIKKNLIYY